MFGKNPSEAITLPLRSWPNLWAFSIQDSIAPILSCCPVPIARDVSSPQNTTALDRTSHVTHHECSIARYSVSDGERFVATGDIFNCSNDCNPVRYESSSISDPSSSTTMSGEFRSEERRVGKECRSR